MIILYTLHRLPNMSSQTHPLLYKGLDIEEAEAQNLQTLEDRSVPPHDSSSFRIFGETPDMGGPSSKTSTSMKSAPLDRFKKAARKVQYHRRHPSKVRDILSSIETEDESAFSSARNLDAERLFAHVDSEDETERASNNLSFPGISRPSDYGSISTVDTQAYTRRRSWRRRISFPLRVVMQGLRAILHSFLVWVSLPLFALAWVLYYYLKNPRFDFMPGSASLSWWLNFFGRQVVTLELSRLTQFLIIDCIMLGTRFALKLCGPHVTLFAIQAKGWPFIASAWALWDLCVLHGDNRFQTHWLWWTGIEIYSQANSGSYIINSHGYLRFLLSLLLAGLATALKRYSLSVRFGRRQFANFKPRLEKLLAEIVLLNEISLLSTQAEESMVDVLETAKNKGLAKKGLTDVHWGSVQRDSDVDSINSTTSNEALAHGLEKTFSENLLIKNQLERWEEPSNRADKSGVASIADVLKFKRALSLLDETKPFGDDFGPAATRDQAIESAMSCYNRLLGLGYTSSVPFTTLELITVSDGVVDKRKVATLRQLFRPDRTGNLTLPAFVQSCDAIYKRLRYFRASVGNASVIDQVLEDMVNGLFYFVLLMFLLTIMKYNPWQLLVPITSLIVSFSFALGASVSKYVEGIMLIAVRRPYDLGDRIFITDVGNIPSAADITGFSYFVEDITLFTTTLRRARTGEVSTISNWSIAGSRIENCNRSPNAIINLELVMHMSILDGENLRLFISALEAYVNDNPRIWDSFNFCRHENIDADNEIVYLVISFRHRNSWQDAARIKLQRADLVYFIHKTATDMGINKETPPARRLLYYGGILEHGQVEVYKKNLLDPKNIRSHSQRNMKFDMAYPEDMELKKGE